MKAWAVDEVGLAGGEPAAIEAWLGDDVWCSVVPHDGGWMLCVAWAAARGQPRLATSAFSRHTSIAVDRAAAAAGVLSEPARSAVATGVREGDVFVVSGGLWLVALGAAGPGRAEIVRVQAVDAAEAPVGAPMETARPPNR